MSIVCHPHLQQITSTSMVSRPCLQVSMATSQLHSLPVYAQQFIHDCSESGYGTSKCQVQLCIQSYTRVETWVHVAESTMEKTIARLGPELKEVPLEASKYIKPRSVLYTMDGTWRYGAGAPNCPAVTSAPSHPHHPTCSTKHRAHHCASPHDASITPPPGLITRPHHESMCHLLLQARSGAGTWWSPTPRWASCCTTLMRTRSSS